MTEAVQWSCRSLIVDSLPTAKQQTGSAWAGRTAAAGHLLGYAIGSLDLKALFGTTLGSTQFKQLTNICAFVLVAAVGVTSWAVNERVLISDGDKSGRKEGPLDVFRRIANTAQRMPARIQAICWIQFWSWIGWFPFLFYSSTWVGETYFRYDAPHETGQSTDRSGDVGRIGSMALITFSLVTLLSSIILPWMVKSPEDDYHSYTPVPQSSTSPLVVEVWHGKPSLVSAYMVAHLIFAASMLLAPLVASVRFATLLVALCGV